MKMRPLFLAAALSALVHAGVLVSPALQWQAAAPDTDATVISATLLAAPQVLPPLAAASPVARKPARKAAPIIDNAPTASLPQIDAPLAGQSEPNSADTPSQQALAQEAAPVPMESPPEKPATPPLDLAAWPQQGRVRYQSSYWGVPVEGEQRWSHDGASFSASLTGSVPVKGELLRQTATGHISGGRPVSEQFSETFNRGQYETQFAPDGSKLVQSRKGNQREVPTEGYALDMLALTHFMAMQPPETESFDIYVVTFRGSVSRVTVVQHAPAPLDLPAGTTLARRFHAMGNKGKLKIDVWLSSDWRNAPVRIRVEDEAGAYDLKADEVEIDGALLARAPVSAPGGPAD